ncbi:hypothetical protein ACH9D2_15420 [Kocuria sp. M4R2S49]|uniref:hypothetical protein n=1 Tax=Kocuria rhizosphaericola TaxID=3376284 RepID=UPI0037ADE52C
MTSSRRPTLRTTAAAALAVAGLGLTSCGAGTTDTADPVEEAESTQEDGILEGGEPTEPYIGPYDSAFVDMREDYGGMEVIVTGQVQETVAPVGFTITGTEDTTLAPLLVFYNPEEASPEAGETVAVTGTIHEVFNPPVVEENVGGDPGPDELAYYHGQPFLRADNVTVAEPQDATPSN